MRLAVFRRLECPSTHLPGHANERAISTMSSREAVGSSLFQATPSPILKSMPLTAFSSKARFAAEEAGIPVISSTDRIALACFPEPTPSAA